MPYHTPCVPPWMPAFQHTGPSPGAALVFDGFDRHVDQLLVVACPEKSRLHFARGFILGLRLPELDLAQMLRGDKGTMDSLASGCFVK